MALITLKKLKRAVSKILFPHLHLIHDNEFVIYHHLGLGDHIICNGLVLAKAKEHGGRNIVIFSKFHNLSSVIFMYRNFPNIRIIGVKGDNDVLKIVKNIPAQRKLLIGYYNNDYLTYPKKSSDEVFYIQANLDFSIRWTAFDVERDREKEEQVYQKLHPGTNYIFVHDDTENNNAISHFYLQNKTIIRPQRDISIWAYLKLIEEADEVHCINSSFMNMINSFEFINNKKNLYFHYYARNQYRDNFQTPRLKNNWIVIEKPVNE